MKERHLLKLMKGKPGSIWKLVPQLLSEGQA